MDFALHCPQKCLVSRIQEVRPLSLLMKAGASAERAKFFPKGEFCHLSDRRLKIILFHFPQVVIMMSAKFKSLRSP
jgi:hypothetical protein